MTSTWVLDASEELASDKKQGNVFLRKRRETICAYIRRCVGRLGIGKRCFLFDCYWCQCSMRQGH